MEVFCCTTPRLTCDHSVVVVVAVEQNTHIHKISMSVTVFSSAHKEEYLSFVYDSSGMQNSYEQN